MPGSQPNVFDAIADPTRRAILARLAERAEAVEGIAARFPMSRPAISKHLRVLLDAGLVRREPHGRENIYRIQPTPLAEVRTWLDAIWNEKLVLLKRLSEGDS